MEKTHTNNVSSPHRFSVAAKIDGEGGLELGLGGDHPHLGVRHHGGLAQAARPEARRLVGLVILQLEQQILFSRGEFS